jgi:hypothetical protein
VVKYHSSQNESSRCTQTNREMIIIVAIVYVFAALAVMFGPTLSNALAAAPAEAKKAVCGDTSMQSNPMLGGGITTYPSIHKVDGLKVETALQFTYPHQVMAQVNIIGHAKGGIITAYHVALHYMYADGTENTCQMEKGAVRSLNGDWIDELDTSYWWTKSPKRADRILVDVGITVTNPITNISRPYVKDTRLHIPF